MIVVLVSVPETRIKYDFVVWAAKQQQGGKEWDDDGDNMKLWMGGVENSASTRWAAQKNHKNSREHSENECDALKGKDDMRGEIPENFIIWKFSINFVFCHCSRDFLSCCPQRGWGWNENVGSNETSFEIVERRNWGKTLSFAAAAFPVC